MTNNQLTKEWLQQTIAELESVRDEIPFGIDTNSELELAAFKMALAAMDSEPVAQDEREAFEAFMAKRFGGTVNQHRANNGDRGYVAWDMVVAWIVWQARSATLQAEPVTTANKLGGSPAQSPIDHGYRKGCECSGCKTTVRICAELAGWIPVSERIPEDEQEVLTINRMGHRFVSLFDKHSGLFFDRLDAPSACCIEHVLVTHWMELPAAPQEVVNGQD